MRALIQRVKESSVSVNGSVHGSIGKGILIFLGVRNDDTIGDAQYLAGRCADLRIFDDEHGKMNLSIKDISGEALVISQFTLYAETRKGNRPSFTEAAPPEIAERLYNSFVQDLCKEIGFDKVKTGIFRSMMDVQLVNDGPVTVQVESKEKNKI
jgi:D-tyrosyl-tRNA(Tyr) deacylase